MKKKAILITFSVKTESFSCKYERNKFFRQLYGWKQIIRKREKRYVYERKGVLSRIPHIKVDESVFIVAEKHFREIERFLQEWEDKVMWEAFEVLLDEPRLKLLEEV
ncbi:MAG: hypothetical protein J7K98_01035 [Candidatus Aenigmarchaeota archaeon]|nr:hypothetical protein [Candidatus Aenigmarchaeota archaeon]